jgi:hypothetical protein
MLSLRGLGDWRWLASDRLRIELGSSRDVSFSPMLPSNTYD